MGLFEKIFKRPAHDGPKEFFRTFSAYTPVFSNFGGSIYESELVRAAIHAKANHISKLDVKSLGAAKPKLQTKLKAGPNEFQTWGQFLYRLSTILDAQNTAFIVPVLDIYGEPSGIYPILPSRCTMEEYDGVPYLRYQFQNGKIAALEMSKCGIMTKFQYESDFFGSNNQALMPTMDLISIQDQGIKEAVKSSASFRFMAKMSNFAKGDDLAKEQRRFTAENLRADSGGVLLFPNTYTDVQQIKSAPFVVDGEQMKAINENVYNYFGVNADVLQNKAFGDAWDAFYEGALEPFAIQFSDVATKMLFTETERAYGAKMIATANRLQYMSVKDKISFAKEMGDRGFIKVNEVREVFNLPPLDGEAGERMPIRGEYYDGKEGAKDDGDPDGETAEQDE